MIGLPGRLKRIAVISSISSRPVSSSGARRRRTPMFSFARGSIAYSAYMYSRSSSVTISSVSSSWLRRKRPHWQESGISGVCSRIETIGVASSRPRAPKRGGVTRERKEPRPPREVEGHVALVAVAEVVDDVGRPLVRLREQHPVGVVRVDLLADPFQVGAGLRQVF